MKRESRPSHVPFREQTQRGREGFDSCPVFESRWTLNNKPPSNVQSRVIWPHWRWLLLGFFTYWFLNKLCFKLLSQVASNGKTELLFFECAFRLSFHCHHRTLLLLIYTHGALWHLKSAMEVCCCFKGGVWHFLVFSFVANRYQTSVLFCFFACLLFLQHEHAHTFFIFYFFYFRKCSFTIFTQPFFSGTVS